MSEASRRLIIVTFVSITVGLLFFLAVSVFAFPVRDVLPRFQWDWILRNAATRLIETLPTLQIFAVTLTFSLLINVMEIRANRGELPTFVTLVNGALVFLLVMTVVYAVLASVVQPVLISGQDDLIAKSEMARRFRNEAAVHMEEEQYVLAVTKLRHYLAINPADTVAAALLTEAESLYAARSEITVDADARDMLRISERRSLTAAQSVELARDYFDDEHYISALYYARLALDLDPTRDDASRIVGRAMEYLSQAAPSEAEREDRRLFLSKQQGYHAYEQGHYLDAYYLFRELDDAYPGDPDVTVYLPLVRGALLEQAFFLEEILPIVALTGGTQLTFLNRDDSDEREYLHIDKIVSARSGHYAFGIEALTVGANGEVRYHLTAPYGKLLDGTLNMQAVSESGVRNVVVPRYFEGSRPSEIAHVLSLDIPVGDLMMLSKANSGLESATLRELLRMTTVLDRYGYGTHRPKMELLRRLLDPFSFITLALFAIALSWQLRSRYVARPPIGALLLVPLLPFAIHYVHVLYRYSMQIVSRHLLLYVGMNTAVVLLFVIEAVLLFAALFAVATRVAE